MLFPDAELAKNVVRDVSPDKYIVTLSTAAIPLLRR